MNRRLRDAIEDAFDIAFNAITILTAAAVITAGALVLIATVGAITYAINRIIT